MRTDDVERVMRLSSCSLTAAASSAFCPEVARRELAEEGARKMRKVTVGTCMTVVWCACWCSTRSRRQAARRTPS